MLNIFSIILAGVLLSTSISSANECPNGEFKLTARYDETFTLNPVSNQYYVAFGAEGKWVITLVRAKWAEGGKVLQKFKCEEKYWFSVVPVKEYGDTPPVCCAAVYDIDAQPPSHIRARPKTTNPFAVLPTFFHDQLSAIDLSGDAFKTEERTAPESYSNYYWTEYLPPPSGIAAAALATDVRFTRWQIMKFTEESWTRMKSRVYVTPVVFPYVKPVVFPPPELSEQSCISTSFHKCNTGITQDIVVFQDDCLKDKKVHTSFIRFAFSADGIFDTHSLLKCPTAGKIYYLPITKLFAHYKQPPPSYNSIGSGWKLGSYCASCPSTSMTIQISEKEAKMNKKRLQHALNIGPEAGPPVAKVKIGYTRMWFNEAGTTITSGRATTISATCNGIYLWYWTVSVGSWGTGDAVIPTQLFYCSDRNVPPVCKPKINKDFEEEFGTMCSGHDVAADFGLADDAKIPWKTFHDGRPKPLRIQGQHGSEPNLMLQQNEIGRAAEARTDEYGDIIGNDKGLIMGKEVNDEYDGQGEKQYNNQHIYGVNDVHLQYYSLYSVIFMAICILGLICWVITTCCGCFIAFVAQLWTSNEKKCVYSSIQNDQFVNEQV